MRRLRAPLVELRPRVGVGSLETADEELSVVFMVRAQGFGLRVDGV